MIDNKEYIRNTLDYSPVIEDSWKPENEIGNSIGENLVDAPTGDIVEAPDDDPFKNEDARNNLILNNSTSDIAGKAIVEAISSLQALDAKFRSSQISYPNTVYIIEHAIRFWNIMHTLVNSYSFTKKDITEYNNLCKTEESSSVELGKLVAILSDPSSHDDDTDVDAIIKSYEDKKSELDNIHLDKDMNRTRCFMISDINRSVISYANDCTYICNNIYSAPDNELNALKKAANITFKGLSSDDVKVIYDTMYDGFMNDIMSLKRVATSSTDEHSMYNHINELSSVLSYKMEAIPKMKYIMRNNQTNYDFTNMVINDMFNKCTSIDEKYTDMLTNTSKYMHAENSILLKTFSSENKLNRFLMSADYIKV